MIFQFDERPSDSPFVERIWRTQHDGGGTFISAAASQCGIVVTKQRGKTTITIRGPETRATEAPIPKDAEFFGIIFKLGTFMPHLPAAHLMNRNDVHLPGAASNSFWIQGSTWEFPTFENADTFINRLIHSELLVRDPIVEAVLQDRPPDMSIRNVRRRFLRATGLTYSEIRQIERARQAAALLQKGVPILDTVFETGYFDQPHLTKSLRYFMGQTPAQIIRLRQSV